MTVENTTNKMTAQQMGESYDYYFNFVVLLTDPTEEEAMAGIKATVKDSDGNETELTYNSSDTDGYTVTLNSSGIGGKITVNDMRSTSDYITIYREYELTQEADFQDFNAAPADTTEQCFDKGIMLAQQLEEELSRSLKFSITSGITDIVLPDPEAGSAIIWNDDATALTNYDLTSAMESFEEDIKTDLNTIIEAADKINELESDIETLTETAEDIQQVYDNLSGYVMYEDLTDEDVFDITVSGLTYKEI